MKRLFISLVVLLGMSACQKPSVCYLDHERQATLFDAAFLRGKAIEACSKAHDSVTQAEFGLDALQDNQCLDRVVALADLLQADQDYHACLKLQEATVDFIYRRVARLDQVPKGADFASTKAELANQFEAFSRASGQCINPPPHRIAGTPG